MSWLPDDIVTLSKRPNLNFMSFYVTSVTCVHEYVIEDDIGVRMKQQLHPSFQLFNALTLVSLKWAFLDDKYKLANCLISNLKY